MCCWNHGYRPTSCQDTFRTNFGSFFFGGGGVVVVREQSDKVNAHSWPEASIWFLNHENRPTSLRDTFRTASGNYNDNRRKQAQFLFTQEDPPFFFPWRAQELQPSNEKQFPPVRSFPISETTRACRQRINLWNSFKWHNTRWIHLISIRSWTHRPAGLRPDLPDQQPWGQAAMSPRTLPPPARRRPRWSQVPRRACRRPTEWPLMDNNLFKQHSQIRSQQLLVIS